VLWLRAWSWLPGTTAAHSAAIATAVLGALTVGVLHAACRAWGARPLAATCAVAIANLLAAAVIPTVRAMRTSSRASSSRSSTTSPGDAALHALVQVLDIAGPRTSPYTAIGNGRSDVPRGPTR
jgi:hypothetical protein